MHHAGGVTTTGCRLQYLRLAEEDCDPNFPSQMKGMMQVADNLVRTEVSDGVTTIVLDAPDSRNALSWELVQQLRDAVVGARDSRALILRNTPPVFSAGGSIDDLLEPKAPLEDIYGAFRALDEAPMPTLAAVDGAAIGAGLNLVLCCDIAICTPRSRFDVRFLDVGIHPGGGSLWRLKNVLGVQGASALTLFGESLDGHEAARRGLVWRCIEDSELVPQAELLAQRAAHHDPELTKRTKATLAESFSLGNPAAAMASELEPQQWSMEQPSFIASLRALRERLGREGSD
jgi:enoyl-CoA hydratase